MLCQTLQLWKQASDMRPEPYYEPESEEEAALNAWILAEDEAGWEVWLEVDLEAGS